MTTRTHVVFAPFVAAIAAIMVPATATAQAMIAPFDADYTPAILGSVPGVPTPYGGVTFKAGDPNTILIGGSANGANGAIYEIQVERGCLGDITGFIGEATLYSTAPEIDGGLTYGPGGVLIYAGYNENLIGQILPGSTSPDKVDLAADFGIAGSLGTLQFVPGGFPGAGRFKTASYSGNTWYELPFTVETDGLLTFEPQTFSVPLGAGPEGILYVRSGNPEFDVDTVLVCEYNNGAVAAFDLDADGNPIIASRRVFLGGLTGAEGATSDPLTGDFIFSTFGGGNNVVAIRGFLTECPGDISPPGGDGEVGFSDLVSLLSQWDQKCTPADINRSGSVEFGDVLVILGSWGLCNG